VILREQRLREDVTEGGAQTASSWIDVTLAALQAGLHRQVGLGLGAQGHKAQCQAQALEKKPGGSVDHDEASTVNVKEQSLPSTCAAMSSAAHRLCREGNIKLPWVQYGLP